MLKLDVVMFGDNVPTDVVARAYEQVSLSTMHLLFFYCSVNLLRSFAGGEVRLAPRGGHLVGGVLRLPLCAPRQPPQC